MRTVILGARGQLGQDLRPLLPGEVIPLTREQLDLARPAGIRPTIQALAPGRVVNCAAYNFVDRAEDEPAAAFAVNAFGVRELALACRDLNCVLVHFSTDHVFGLDPARTTPYREDDAPGPVSAYGASKLAGEHFVRALCPRHFVIRTCGLYGHHGSGGKGTNFVEIILRKAAEGAALRVVDDQRCSPTATADLARAVAALIATPHYGLYHLTATGSCTWFEFARRVVETAGRTANLQPVTSEAYGAKARRPAYSVLDGARYRSFDLPLMPDVWESLENYLRLRPGRASSSG